MLRSARRCCAAGRSPTHITHKRSIDRYARL